MIRLVLKDRPWSWNKHWSGVHWSERSAEKQRVAFLVRSAINEQLERPEIFEGPVEIFFSFYNGGRKIDWDNVCIKPYQDALIDILLGDDNPDHVVAGHILLFEDKEDPRLEIEIIPVSIS